MTIELMLRQMVDMTEYRGGHESLRARYNVSLESLTKFSLFTLLVLSRHKMSISKLVRQIATMLSNSTSCTKWISGSH